MNLYDQSMKVGVCTVTVETCPGLDRIDVTIDDTSGKVGVALNKRQCERLAAMLVQAVRTVPEVIA